MILSVGLPSQKAVGCSVRLASGRRAAFSAFYPRCQLQQISGVSAHGVSPVNIVAVSVCPKGRGSLVVNARFHGGQTGFICCLFDMTPPGRNPPDGGKQKTTPKYVKDAHVVSLKTIINIILRSAIRQEKRGRKKQRIAPRVPLCSMLVAYRCRSLPGGHGDKSCTCPADSRRRTRSVVNAP